MQYCCSHAAPEHQVASAVIFPACGLPPGLSGKRMPPVDLVTHPCCTSRNIWRTTFGAPSLPSLTNNLDSTLQPNPLPTSAEARLHFMRGWLSSPRIETQRAAAWCCRKRRLHRHSVPRKAKSETTQQSQQPIMQHSHHSESPKTINSQRGPQALLIST